MPQIDGKQIKSATVSETQLTTSVAGDGLAGGAGSALSVNTSTGLTTSGDAVVVDTATGSVTFTGGTWTYPTDVLQITGTPDTGNDAVNKTYADSLINGLSWKDAAKAGSTVDLESESFGSSGVTYANGTAGVGATLTQDVASDGALTDLDAISLANGDRVLIRNQSTGFENGLYEVTEVGDGSSTPWVLTRVTDCDDSSEHDSAAVFVQQGTTNGDKAFTQTTDAPTIGTDSLVWTEFASAAAATVYTTITGDSGSATASTSTDTLDFTGGDGITTTAAEGSPDSVTIDVVLEAAGAGTGGLAFDSAEVRVLAGDGIVLTTDGVEPDLEAAGAGTGGLELTATGGSGQVAVLAGDGIALTADGVEPDLEAAGAGTGGLELTASGGSGQIAVLAGDGIELTASGVAVQALNDSIAVAGGGISAAVPVDNNKNMTASVTSSDGDQGTATTLAAAPGGDSMVRVYVNGVAVQLGFATTGVESYFSGDGGTSARTLATLTSGDTWHWVGSVAGYELAASDVIDWDYVNTTV